MNYTEKSDIINSLAARMGVLDPHDTKSGVARYDSSTGTLYCEGITLPHSNLEKIRTWFKMQMLTYRDMMTRDPGVNEMFMRFAVAYNAILLLEDNMNDKNL